LGRIILAENDLKKNKLKELLANGYEFTGKTYKISMGEHKGKEFPIYAMKGDIAGLVYNEEADKVELVFKLNLPFAGVHSKTKESLREIKKTNEIHENNNP
jgi:hypothetical protein